MIIKKYDKVYERFYSQTIKLENGCLEWIGCIDRHGYGKTSVYKKYYSAHRLAWELHCGPIFGAAQVLHTCDKRNCVNVKHLFLGTNAINTQDCIAKGRKVYVIHNQKLTEEMVREIRENKDGLNQSERARKYNVHHSTISDIVLNRIWIHVK